MGGVAAGCAQWAALDSVISRLPGLRLCVTCIMCEASSTHGLHRTRTHAGEYEAYINALHQRKGKAIRRVLVKKWDRY